MFPTHSFNQWKLIIEPAIQISTSALGMYAPNLSGLSCSIIRLCRHLGVTAIDPQRGDIDKVISALSDSLVEAREAKGISK